MPTRRCFGILDLCRRSFRYCGCGLSSRVVQARRGFLSSVDVWLNRGLCIGDCLRRFVGRRLLFRRCRRCHGSGSAIFGVIERLGDTVCSLLWDFGGKRSLGRGEVATCCFQSIRGRRLECGNYTTSIWIGWCNSSGSSMQDVLFW